MAETDDPFLPHDKEKAVCFRGAKCRRKSCKYSHPRPTADVTHGDEHDSSVHPEPTKETNYFYTEKQGNSHSGQEHATKAFKSKSKAGKLCKFGNDCRRKTCPYLHPQEEMTPMTSSQGDSVTVDDTMAVGTSKENFCLQEGDYAPSSDSRELAIHDNKAEMQDTVEQAAVERPHVSSKPGSRKSKRRCFKGARCRKHDCPFRHPSDPPLQNGQQENVVMMDVAILEAEIEAETEIPLAADLEDSLVDQAQENQESVQQHEPPVDKKKRRNKEDSRRRRQLEEDRLIQEEDERLKQKAEDEAAEQERLQQQEAEELDRMLQDQERQRQAKAEMEQQRLVKEEAERRLSAEKARIEIDLIRRSLSQKDQAKRAAPLLADTHGGEIEELRDPERVRAEREALERFKRLHEEQKKSEEAAKRPEEEERKMQQQQDDMIRRERGNEAELRRSAEKKSKDHRRSQVEADEEAHRNKEASKVQEDDLLDDKDDEERERYKAQRKAAKKERRRLENEAKAGAGENASTQSPSAKQDRSCSDGSLSQSQSSTGSNQDNIFEANTPESEAEDEAAMKHRWQEELKRQKERAAEKREQKQKLRRERLLEDLVRQTQERTEFWNAKIADENIAINLLVQLCAAEFCRKNPYVVRETFVADDDAKRKLVEAAQETYRSICKAEIHSRVIVKGMKQQDLNDRPGTIQSWDAGKGKFHVGLDTKKGKNTQYLYIPPANLEALPLPSPRKGKKKGDPVHMVFISTLFAERELMVDVYKNEFDSLKKAASLDEHLKTLMEDRDREEEESKEKEGEERRRRAEQRHRENMEWERRRREYADQKAEYQEWRRQQRVEKKARAQARERGEREYYDEREHTRYCDCPRCEFEHMFFGGVSGGRGGPGIFFSFGSGGPGIFFSSGDDDYDEDCEDQWDHQWEQMHEEELAEKNLEAAETLGVEVEASESEIKHVFRKKARKYHPDSFRAENHEDGMTKEEAEEHFKELSNAYDHLMSNFDDESDEE